MWPFTRKPKPLNPGPINEDWRVGDLAECVLPRGHVWPKEGPDNGDVTKVTDVVAGLGKQTGKPGWFLGLSGFHNNYEATGFRKVPPLNSAATAEFSESIKALRPKKVRA